MKERKKEIKMNLKYSNNEIVIPLFIGNNVIVSDFFPEVVEEKIILFNLNIINDEEAILRTFENSFIKFQFNNNFEQESISNICNKNSIININTLKSLKIFPFFNQDFYFFLEPVQMNFYKEEEKEINSLEQEHKIAEVILIENENIGINKRKENNSNDNDQNFGQFENEKIKLNAVQSTKNSPYFEIIDEPSTPPNEFNILENVIKSKKYFFKS
jgi:hypothetical protein